ncbi:MAG TPA: alpha/beta hydrolase [Ktedonobacterales bacterium]
MSEQNDGSQLAQVAQSAAEEAHERFALPPGCVEGYLTANGQRLHYVEAGAGPLVLLLHGFPEFWYSWRALLPALAPTRHVVALDMRGYNLSDKPETGYDVATLSDDIRGVIEALGERQADIVGHDWGGALAWVFAMREPDYLRRLVIINAPHPAMMLYHIRRPRQMRRSWYIGVFQLRGFAERAMSADNYGPIWRIFRSADPDRAWLDDADIQRFVDAIARPGVLTAALNYYRQLARRPQAMGVARVVTAPTLVLWGEQDVALGVEVLDGLEEWARDLRIERFPQAGHWLNQQLPDQVNPRIAAFLNEER